MFITTHHIDEAEVHDRIAVIDHGRIVALDTPEGLKRQVGGDVVRARVPCRTDAVEAFARESALAFMRDEDRVRFESRTGRGSSRLVAAFPGLIQGVSLHRPTLDDVFLKLTGRAIRDAKLEGNDVARARTRALAARHGLNARRRRFVTRRTIAVDRHSGRDPGHLAAGAASLVSRGTRIVGSLAIAVIFLSATGSRTIPAASRCTSRVSGPECS